VILPVKMAKIWTNEKQINEETSKRGAEGDQVSSFCLFFNDFIRTLSNYFGVQKWVVGC
jgi:hypothetical protein